MKKNSKIYVAGHNGLVGSSIVRKLKNEGHKNILTFNRSELDLTKKADVEKQKPKLTAAQKQKLVEKIHGVLKKHYSPQSPNTTRPLLEQVLFACCLENSHYGDAEKAFSNLMENAFHLNEIIHN